MTTFAERIDQGWAEHSEHPKQVADWLAGSLAEISAAEQIEPFARLAAHVFGEHLGEWTRGIELLETLRASRVCGAAEATAIGRHVAALGCASGDESSLAALAREDAACALAAAAAACAGRKDFSRAIALYERALAQAQPTPAQASPAIRSLAIAGNNLAAALEDKSPRSEDERRGMLGAARGALAHWKLAGGWLEEERAEFRLARSLTAAGEPREGAEHAQRCLTICERHDAPAFERFFAYYALAAALRAAGDDARFEEARSRALSWLAKVPADEQRGCDAERRELGDGKS